MKIEKKYLIAAGIGVVSITAGLVYLQYKKLMNYCIGFKSIKVNKLTGDNVDINVFLSFENKSDLKIEIENQEYDVYLNDSIITKAKNSATQTIQPKSVSAIGVNVKFNPTKSGQKLLDTILGMGKFVIRVDIKLKIKLWFFTVNVPYQYVTTLKELMTPSQTVEPKKTCK